jgi:tetratricopeptide (TPR) repeat protein
MQEFKVNKYITLNLEEGKTKIYIQNREFMICKRLFLQIPEDSTFEFDEIDSIDEAEEVYKKNLMYGQIYEGIHNDKPVEVDISITPEEEFWGHCSNIQVWAENDYDTRILHSNITFPLLRKLTSVGDLKAKRIFKEELAIRISSGHIPTIRFLILNGFLYAFSKEEQCQLFYNEKDELKEFMKSFLKPIHSYEKDDLIILKCLADIGDQKAIKLLKEEIAYKISLEDIKTIINLILGGYVFYFDKEELRSLFYNENFQMKDFLLPLTKEDQFHQFYENLFPPLFPPLFKDNSSRIVISKKTLLKLLKVFVKVGDPSIKKLFSEILAQIINHNSIWILEGGIQTILDNLTYDEGHSIFFEEDDELKDFVKQTLQEKEWFHNALAFPILRRLSEMGDPIARIRLIEEIFKKFFNGHIRIVGELVNEGYLETFSKDELKFLVFDEKNQLRSYLYDLILSKSMKLAIKILEKITDKPESIIKSIIEEETPKQKGKLITKKVIKKILDGSLKIKYDIITNAAFRNFNNRNEIINLLENANKQKYDEAKDQFQKSLQSNIQTFEEFIKKAETHTKFIELIIDYVNKGKTNIIKKILINIGFFTLREEDLILILNKLSKKDLIKFFPFLIDLLEFKPIYSDIKLLFTRYNSRLVMRYISKNLLKDYIKTIFSFDENSLDSVNQLAEACYKIQFYEKASQLYDQALELDKNNWKSFYFKGIMHFLDRKPEKAEIRLEKAFNLAPKGTLLKKGKSDPLEYHQEIFNFLGITPYVSIENLKILNLKEEELGISFPKAVKEWYSIAGSQELLFTYSNGDPSVPVEVFLINDQGMIEFIDENQDVCQWAFNIKEDKNPPVMITNTGGGGAEKMDDWDVYSDTFSNFIYSWISYYYFFFKTYYLMEIKIETELDVSGKTSNYLREKLKEVQPDRFSSKTKYFLDKGKNQFIEISPHSCKLWAKNQKGYEELLRLILNFHTNIKDVKIKNELILINAIKNIMGDFPSIEFKLSKVVSAPLPLNLIVLGDELLSYSISHSFMNKENESITVMRSPETFHLERSKFKLDQDTINLRIKGYSRLDEEEFKSELERANGIIITIDLSSISPNSEFFKQFNVVKDLKPNIPILILGIKKDLVESNEINNREIKDLITPHNSVEFKELSLKMGEKIAQAFNHFLKKILKIFNH